MNFSVTRTSLCEVFIEDGRRKLARLLDYDERSGRLIKFDVDYRRLPNFSNRSVLFLAPNDNANAGAIGVWEWKAAAVDASGSKDWVETFAQNREWIEVVTIPSATNLNELQKALAEGFECKELAGNVLFTTDRCNETERNYGILCAPLDLKRKVDDDSKVILRESVYSLPYVEVSKKDVLSGYEQKTFKNWSFYNRFMEEVRPDGYVYYFDRAIRNTLVSRLRDRVKPKDLRSIEEFLESAPRDNIIEEIAKLCKCDKEIAAIRLEDFLAHIPYLGEPSDFKLLATMVRRDNALQAYCKSLFEDEWREELQSKTKEYDVMLEEREKKVETLALREKESEERMKDMERDLEGIQQRYNELTGEVAELEKWKAEARERVQEEILAAQADSTGFLAKCALFSSIASMQNPKVEAQVSSVAEAETPKDAEDAESRLRCFYPGRPILLDKTGEVKTPEDVDDEMVELEDAIIGSIVNNNQEVASYAAGVLCYLYHYRQSILLVGANALRLAEIMSKSILGRTPDFLNCDGDWDQASVDAAFADKESILIVKNPFNGAWFDRLIVEISNVEKTVVLIAPFIEELQVEPVGLYDYVAPITTESFLWTTLANFEGDEVIRPEELREVFIPKHNDENFEKLAKSFGMRCELRRRLSNVFGAIKNEIGGNLTSAYYLLGLYPYAALTGRRDEFNEALNKDKGNLDNKIVKYLAEL